MHKKLTRQQILRRGGIAAMKLTIKEELKKIMKPKRKIIKNSLSEIKRFISRKVKKWKDLSAI